MDKTIPEFYRIYGKYINSSRAFPLSIDGLKPVERRVLLTTYQIAREKFTKSARIDGHCLVGSTKIKLASGEIKTIEELFNNNEENFYVFSFDIENSKPVITKADCVKLNGFVRETIEIETESGVIQCTGDHEWLTKLGEYKRADELQQGDELESVQFSLSDEKGLYNGDWVGIGNNHTVLEIRIISHENPIPVYDIINCKDYHNFAIIFNDNTSLISSNCIGHYSPHGSVYGTTVQMVRQGFLEGQGNFGCSLGVESSPPAAMRYTECKLKKDTYELVFKLINYVPWVESELDNEPAFLPTKFPICLLGTEPTQGIGFGYKTYIPCYRIEDLYARLIWLLDPKGEEPVIKPINDCKILSKKEDLRKLLTTGKATLEVQGILQTNPARHRAVIKSWPAGKRFDSILSKISKELENQDVGFQDLSSNDNLTHIQFEVLKLRGRDAIFEKFVPKLQDALNGSISYDVVVVDEYDNVGTKSIDEMLVNTYKMFTSVNGLMLREDIRKLEEDLSELQLLEKLKPHIQAHLSSVDKAMDYIIGEISTGAGVDPSQVRKLLSKHSIRKLLAISTDAKEILRAISKNKESLKNIGNFVLQQYEMYKGGK